PLGRRGGPGEPMPPRLPCRGRRLRCHDPPPAGVQKAAHPGVQAARGRGVRHHACDDHDLSRAADHLVHQHDDDHDQRHHDPPGARLTGAWTFVGTLAEDSCGAGPGLAETFVISQSGTALEVTVESLPGVTLGGRVTEEGFQASGTFVESGCTVEVALTAYNDGTVVLTAGTGLDFDCPFASSCRSIWT